MEGLLSAKQKTLCIYVFVMNLNLTQMSSLHLSSAIIAFSGGRRKELSRGSSLQNTKNMKPKSSISIPYLSGSNSRKSLFIYNSKNHNNQCLVICMYNIVQCKSSDASGRPQFWILQRHLTHTQFEFHGT